jgi:ADP-heptose:LPS heptosyltransferase
LIRTDTDPSRPAILFVTYTRIGDAVLSTGVLAELARRCPTARISVAASPLTAPLFQAHPQVERVIILRKRPYLGHWRDLWLAAAPRRWDLVVDLRRSAIAWLVRAKRRLVPDKGAEREHRLATLARMLNASGGLQPTCWIDPAAQSRAAALSPADRPVLAVAPTANSRAKSWPAAHYADLVRRLTAEGAPLAEARVLVTGGPDEAEQARPVLEAIPPDRRIDALGLDLPTTAAVFARCRLYVGNDSGLTHLAAAAGTPTVALFGPTDARTYGPTTPASRIVHTPESAGTLHERARENPSQNHRLMANLEVATVETAVRDLLAQRCGHHEPEDAT